MDCRIIAQIFENQGKYRGMISFRKKTYPLEELVIGLRDQIMIKDQAYSIDTLLQKLTAYHDADLDWLFDERGQATMGKYLYDQLLRPGGKELIPFNELRNTELRILTADEHAGRLPWELLADPSGNYVSGAGCAVSLAADNQWFPVTLPPCPKLLIAAPQPASGSDTRADGHLKALEEMLIEADHRYHPGNYLRIVETWEAFQDSVRNFQPDAIYFYGHGDGDLQRSRLIFVSGRGRQEKAVALSDMADLFRHLPEKMPALVYLNCCSGDAGGLFGAGRQLSQLPIPAVVTNRTIAKIEAAQKQAEIFWRSVLLDGQAPDRAILTMRRDLSQTGVSFADVRWLTPALHAHYSQWVAHPPQKINRLIHDSYWALKLDRVEQYSKVAYYTRLMLKERKPKILVYLWYGQEGQGVDLFHQRLTVELRDDVGEACFGEKLADWPQHVIDPNSSFEHIALDAFEAETLNHIPSAFRQLSRGRNVQTLIYLRHRPLRSTKVIGIRQLKQYLEWLDTYLARLLGKNDFIICGISYILNKPAEFSGAVKKKIMTQFQRISFRLLDEMEKVNKDHLIEFITTHRIPFPTNRLDQILDRIMAKTDGQYEMTLDELKAEANKPFNPADELADEGDEKDEGGFGADD